MIPAISLYLMPSCLKLRFSHMCRSFLQTKISKNTQNPQNQRFCPTYLPSKTEQKWSSAVSPDQRKGRHLVSSSSSTASWTGSSLGFTTYHLFWLNISAKNIRFTTYFWNQHLSKTNWSLSFQHTFFPTFFTFPAGNVFFFSERLSEGRGGRGGDELDELHGVHVLTATARNWKFTGDLLKGGKTMAGPKRNYCLFEKMKKVGSFCDYLWLAI